MYWFIIKQFFYAMNAYISWKTFWGWLILFNCRLVKCSSDTRGRITRCSFVIFLLHLNHITDKYLCLCNYRMYVPTSNNVKCIFYLLFIFLEYGFMTLSLMHSNVYLCYKFETYLSYVSESKMLFSPLY